MNQKYCYDNLLIIEPDIILLGQIYSCFKNNFKNITKTYDGLQGFDEYLKLSYDIIIINSNISHINTFELVVKIRELSDTPIIIFGYKTDEYLLLEILDIRNLILIEYTDSLEPLKHHILNYNNTPKYDTNLFSIIKDMTNKSLLFYNNYKGIDIQHDEKIIALKENTFLAKVSRLQRFVIQYQGYTIIKYQDKYIYSILEKLNQNNIVEFKNPKYIDFKSRDQNKRLIPDNKFKISAFYNNTDIDSKIKDISYNSCVIFVNKKDINFNITDQLDITIGFELAGLGIMANEKKFMKIFAKASIIRIEKLKNTQKLVLNLYIAKSGQSSFARYLEELEVTIIKELKWAINENYTKK